MKCKCLRAGERVQAVLVGMRGLALRLQIASGMSRLFLSGQMTCAMLLGAGLLLRAQAALREPPQSASTVSVESPRTRPSELMGERARTPPRIIGDHGRLREARSEGPEAPRSVHRSSHTRKGFAHHARRLRVRKCGVALAGRGFRCS